MSAGGRARRATRLVFVAAGAGTSVWAALIPFAQARAGLDDGRLGLMLLGLACGSILSMPVAGAMAGRVGCRMVTTTGLLVVVAAMPLLAVLPSFGTLGLALLVFGAGFGALDVSMNLQAILVERDSGRAIMSGLHAMYSLGGILGAAAMAAMLGLGLPPLAAVAAMAAMLLVLLALAWPDALPYGTARDGPLLAVPRGVVLLLGAMCAVAFLAEGAVFDWGGVFLSGHRGLAPAYGGLGYAAFSGTMVAGRLLGDRVVARFGPARVVAASGVVTALGLVAAVALPGWPLSLAGFALVGIGCANMVPVLFSAVGRQRRMPEAQALTAVTTMGYAGMLGGPSGIGLLATAVGLPLALLAVAVLLLGLAVAARWMPRREPGT